MIIAPLLNPSKTRFWGCGLDKHGTISEGQAKEGVSNITKQGQIDGTSVQLV